TDAVNSALDRARTASRDIQADALDASERAAKALSALKAASLDATATARQLRAETGVSDADVRASKLTVEPDPYLHDGSARETTSDKPAAPRGPSQPTLEDDDVFDEEDKTSSSAVAAETPDDGELFESPPVARDEARTDNAVETAQASSVQAVNENEAGPTAGTSEPVQFRRRVTDRLPGYLKPVGGRQVANLAAAESLDEEDEEEQATGSAETEPPEAPAEPEPEAAPAAERADSQQWRDIIADMERDEHETLPREENAEEVIHRLMDSGIRLNEIFRPRDKKRIASAARKSEGMRRKAIVDAAARQVQRVQKRLDIDGQLMTMAREFLAMEEPDALMALDKTCHSSKPASARLSAFLLIDAALG
ncbi:MAG: hypothetical protein WA989_14405, partial [Henriciella sp.]|uniref:hypothetical protein n=1 Tax=Henriciella sp. TaxID=1968823 RepID=UPI003C7391F0